MDWKYQRRLENNLFFKLGDHNGCIFNFKKFGRWNIFSNEFHRERNFRIEGETNEVERVGESAEYWPIEKNEDEGS